MLPANALLDHRYRIKREIGGGGQATVYLAEDNRFSAHERAIKELSPSQLSPQDLGWAIPAFQQEAHLLAQLNHPGVVRVSDHFEEGGDWYLVMDYVPGQTLGKWLEQMPRGLPLNIAVNYALQLCAVLDYLHTQTPPVIFRDLKPDNVMVTPSGDLKLIDFGIARFFKPGQTHNTVNLGTPGYASPEHGGKGQTDPRSDIYSLGVMLHQMVTGYDPTATPFTLPPARSLNATVPQYVEDVIRRATQLQPAQRFQTVAEFRQALLVPAQAGAGRIGPTGTKVISGAGNGSGVSVGQGPTPSRKWWPVFALLGFAVVVILLLASQLILPPPPTPTPLPRPPVTVPVAGPPPASVPQQPTSAPRQPASASSPSSSVQPPSQPQISSPTPPDVAVDDTPLGRSVDGRDITMLKVGKPDGPAVFVVGSIEGDQPDTSSIVYQLADHYRTRPAEVPNGSLLFLIPSLNPDGNANDSRFNLNGVDLNRNWDTANWKKDADVPGGSKAGSGGSQPFSEPETRALRDLINSLLSRGQPVTLIVLHSTVNDSLSNQVFPGYTASGIHGPSEDVTRRVGNVLGYRYNTKWSYDTTGEAIAWAAEQSIPAVDIVPKKNNSPALSKMIQVITEIPR